jgi:hypothetical protein
MGDAAKSGTVAAGKALRNDMKRKAKTRGHSLEQCDRSGFGADSRESSCLEERLNGKRNDSSVFMNETFDGAYQLRTSRQS